MKKITINYFFKLNLKGIFLKSFFVSLLLIVGVLNSFGQFTAGNLVVEQVGDGTTALTSAAITVKLLQFTPSGTPATGTAFFGSTGTPTTSPYNIVESGTATSNGYISLSTDKSFILIPGYNAPNGTASIAGSASATYGRTIGKLTSNGALQTNGTFNAIGGNNYRSVVSNGTGYWMSGGAGIAYTATDATSNITTTGTSIFGTNTRLLTIFNNTLFASSSSTTFNGTGSSPGIYQIGSFNSPPTATVTAGTAVIIINATSTGSPYGFTFSPDGLTCYVADDRATVAGGVQKWTYSGTFSTSTGWSVGGTWTLAYTLGTGVASIGARGLTVDFSGTNSIIYGISAETALNRMFTVTDTGSGSTATTLATSTTNYIFRGISFAPITPPTISVIESSVPAMTPSDATKSITVSGSNLTANITLALSGTNPTQFSVLPTSLTQTLGAVASTSVAINYLATDNSANSAILTISSPGATSKTFNLSGGPVTGLSMLNSNLKAYVSNGNVSLNALAGQTIELFNSVGQKLKSQLAVNGLNTIQLSAKGIVLVKVGNQISKVVL